MVDWASRQRDLGVPGGPASLRAAGTVAVDERWCSICVITINASFFIPVSRTVIAECSGPGKRVPVIGGVMKSMYQTCSGAPRKVHNDSLTYPNP